MQETMWQELARVLQHRRQPPSSSLLQGAQSALFFRLAFLLLPFSGPSFSRFVSVFWPFPPPFFLPELLKGAYSRGTMCARIPMSRLMMAAVLMAVVGCAGQESREKLFVQSQHDSDIDFGAYHSYAWVPGDAAWANPVFLNNPELPGMISAAVDRTLAAKGFEKASADAADFLVAMSASVQDVTVISKHRYQGWSHGYNRWALINASTPSQLNKMTEGTLILEVIDTASEGVVWQSRAAGVITRRDELEKTVEAAVARMLQTFPPDS